MVFLKPLPKESARAFAAFQHYRDLDRDRSVGKAWRASEGITDTTQDAPKYWKNWGTKHKWVARAAAYDEHMQLAAQRSREKLVVQQATIRQDLEIEVLQRILKRTREIEVVLDKFQALPATDVFNRRTETIKGLNGEPDKVVETVTRVKGIGGSEFAKILKAQSELHVLGVNGIRKEASKQDGQGNGVPLEPKAALPQWLVTALNKDAEQDSPSPGEPGPTSRSPAQDGSIN